MYLNKKASEEEGFTNMNSELMGNNRDQGGVKPSEGVGENEVFHGVKFSKFGMPNHFQV